MNYILILEILYVLFIGGVLIRILYDTRSVTKTLAYILLVIFLPVIGVFIYFSIGINYRKNILYSKKIIQDKKQEQKVLTKLQSYQNKNLEVVQEDHDFSALMKMVYSADRSPVTTNNTVQLLINGEEKFPEVLKALQNAKNHIHIEYYIYEDDITGKAIENILIEKAKSGVEVRFIYDDFGSASIRKTLAKRLADNGIPAFPFYKIKLIHLANRLNYRNHRKIIVIDGETSFIGGINISDKYRNDITTNKLFWRDTHLKITGDATAILQHLFIADWNYCSNEKLVVTESYFPKNDSTKPDSKTVQIVASGPDSERPSIYFAMVKAVQSAREEICLTSPYFIPGETITDALVMAALSGVKVQLLVPGISDSVLVNSAAKSYYTDLLKAGVEIYLYQKGFVHAKTLVADRKLAIVGTANCDYRSFDLNFEVNALVYDVEIANELAAAFLRDLADSKKIIKEEWLKRPKYLSLFEKIARLVSPLL